MGLIPSLFKPSKESVRDYYERVVRPADERAIIEVKTQKALADFEAKATRAVQISATIWKQPQLSTYNFERSSKEGYGGNEVFFACVEALCTSAAEAKWKAIGHDDEPLPDDHPVHQLLAKPNPFLTGYNFTASLIMFRSIGGNVFVEKVLTNGGDLVEMWLIRPDRMEIRGTTQPIGYTFRFGQYVVDYPLNEIGHYKTRNPLDQFWGMPPIMPLLSRIDTDNFAREFCKAFFFNAGVPATLINFRDELDKQEREMIKSTYKSGFTGTQGWHEVMITEGNEVDVKPLGMPMGQRGIAYPELDEIEEARIAMVMGVPLTIIGARLGQKSSSYANRLSDREQFWNQTLVPIYREIEAEYNTWLIPHFPDVKRMEADLTSVIAFQDETDVLHTRWRNNHESGLVAWREARKYLGKNDDPDDDDLIFVPSGGRYVKFSEFKAGQGYAPDIQPGAFGGSSGRSDDAPQRPSSQPMLPGKPNSNAQ